MLETHFLFMAPKVGGAPKNGKMVKSITSFRFKLMFMILLESVLQSKAKKSLGAEFLGPKFALRGPQKWSKFTVLNRCVNRIKYLIVLLF